jgi:hypothetical protein
MKIRRTNRKETKIKKRWIHYYWTESNGIYPFDDIVCACGKRTSMLGVAYQQCPEAFTRDINKVTCPRCIEKLKEKHYYCEEHGFVVGADVTYDEKCAHCGRDV